MCLSSISCFIVRNDFFAVGCLTRHSSQTTRTTSRASSLRLRSRQRSTNRNRSSTNWKSSLSRMQAFGAAGYTMATLAILLEIAANLGSGFTILLPLLASVHPLLDLFFAFLLGSSSSSTFLLNLPALKAVPNNLGTSQDACQLFEISAVRYTIDQPNPGRISDLLLVQQLQHFNTYIRNHRIRCLLAAFKNTQRQVKTNTVAGLQHNIHQINVPDHPRTQRLNSTVIMNLLILWPGRAAIILDLQNVGVLGDLRTHHLWPV